MCTCGFQSRHPLPEALSFNRGCAVLRLLPWFRETCAMLHWWIGGVQAGTCPKSLTSPYILQRSRSLHLSILGHSSAPSLSHECVRVRQVPAAPSALPLTSPGRLPSVSPLSYSKLLGFPLTHQTSWRTLFSFSLPSF